jgi:hypothetical protein
MARNVKRSRVPKSDKKLRPRFKSSVVVRLNDWPLAGCAGAARLTRLVWSLGPNRDESD